MRHAAFVAALVLLPGCFLFGPGGAAACADDRFGCRSGDLVEAATCDADDELVVRLGAGEGGFHPLAPGEQPPVIFGAQGGQHTFLGVEIANAELHSYDRILVEIGIYPASACPLEGAPCEDEPWVGYRSVVLGEFEPLTVTDDGRVQEFGILVFLGGTEEAEAVVQLNVEDPCGRRGVQHHTMPTDGIGW